jgi:hypothetical protein
MKASVMDRKKKDHGRLAAAVVRGEVKHSYDFASYTPRRKRKLVPPRGEHPALHALRASLARTTEPALRDRIAATIAALAVRS